MAHLNVHVKRGTMEMVPSFRILMSAVARCMIVIRMLIASTLKSDGTATVRKALMAMERTVLVRVVLLKGTFA